MRKRNDAIDPITVLRPLTRSFLLFFIHDGRLALHDGFDFVLRHRRRRGGRRRRRRRRRIRAAAAASGGDVVENDGHLVGGVESARWRPMMMMSPAQMIYTEDGKGSARGLGGRVVLRLGVRMTTQQTS